MICLAATVLSSWRSTSGGFGAPRSLVLGAALPPPLFTVFSASGGDKEVASGLHIWPVSHQMLCLPWLAEFSVWVSAGSNDY